MSLTRLDKLILVIVITIGLLSFAVVKQVSSHDSANEVVVKINSKKVASLAINYDKVYVFQNNGLKCWVEIKNKKIRIKKTKCPNKLCYKQGFISAPGDSIVCAPMRLIVTIPIKQKKVVDFVTR
ncbi:MAG: hypothetical protein C4562_05875 [Actinobacteria bacterium]|nr:MAG: hypothetical protein C4562_05875 [Actinomycetota bacterium]